MGACAWVRARWVSVTFFSWMAFPFMEESSRLSCSISRMSPRCDSMVAPCSTMSMVISPEETMKRTVKRGSKVCFLGAMGASGVMATSEINVVKWHPVLSLLTSGFPQADAAIPPLAWLQPSH